MTVCFDDRWAAAAFRHLLPKLSIPDMWSIHAAKKFQAIEVEYDGLPGRYSLQSQFNQKATTFMEAARFRSLVIREQLLDLLTERGSTMDIEDAPSEDDEDDEAKYEKRAIAKLEHPTSLFECKSCGSMCDWKAAASHTCAVYDLAYPDYETYCKKGEKTLCKPVGFHRDRFMAPPELPAIFQLLTTVVAEVTGGNEWRYQDFTEWNTHAQAEACHTKAWLFSCSPETCEDPQCAAKLQTERYGRVSFRRRNLKEFVSQCV